MPDKTFIKEKLKDLAIVLLSLLAIFLLSKTLLFSQDSIARLKSAFTGSVTDTSILNEDKGQSVNVEPFSIVSTTQTGAHYAMKYSSDARVSAYSVFSASLAEALGTAYAPKEISLDEFFSDMKSTGVFFDFVSPVPLSILSDSLRTEVSEYVSAVSTRRLFITSTKSQSYLYYIDSQTGICYKCSTSMSSGHFTSKIAEFPVGSDMFVFESEYKDSDLDPFFTISQNLLQMPSVVSQGCLPTATQLDLILAAFDINPRTMTNYTDADDSDVYVDVSKTLKIDPSGQIVFASAGDGGVPLGDMRSIAGNTDLLITKANQLAKSCIHTPGDASLVYSGISGTPEENSYIIYFDYSISGALVAFPDGNHAAEIEISNGFVVHASFKCRSYTRSGTYTYPLPDEQLAAASLQAGGEPILRYSDSLQGVSLSWFRKQ